MALPDESVGMVAGIQQNAITHQQKLPELKEAQAIESKGYIHEQQEGQTCEASGKTASYYCSSQNK